MEVSFEIKFEIKDDDQQLIHRIGQRAKEIWDKYDAKLDLLTLEMDLTAAHANGCQLNLQGLLGAPEFDFIHDIAGITQHLDRLTGQLTNLFIPRYAVAEGPRGN